MHTPRHRRDSVTKQSPQFKKHETCRKSDPTLWRLGVLTCLVKTWVVAGLFAFSDYVSDYIFEEISRSGIEGVGGCYGWS